MLFDPDASAASLTCSQWLLFDGRGLSLWASESSPMRRMFGLEGVMVSFLVWLSRSC